MVEKSLLLIFVLFSVVSVQLCLTVSPAKAAKGPAASGVADSETTVIKQSGETVVRRIEATGETVVEWVEDTVGGTSYHRAKKYGRRARDKFNQFTEKLPDRILGFSYGGWALLFFVVFVVAFLVSLVIGFITKLAWYLALVFLVLALISWFIG